MNKRVTPRERGLLKGAIRRVFSRSDIRKSVIHSAVIKHSDSKRKRVKTWCMCAVCKKPDAISNMQVDHIDPVVPLSTTFADMNLDDFINNLWCHENNLQPICKSCHYEKGLIEKEQRKLNKKRKKRR